MAKTHRYFVAFAFPKSVSALSIAVIVAAISGTASAATPPSHVAGSAASTVDITVWDMYAGYVAGVTTKLTNEFNSANSGIHVTLLHVPSSNGDQKLLTSIAAGDPPSAFLEWNPYIGGYAAQKAIQPLNQFMKGKYAGVLKWLSPTAAADAEWDGRLYGLPDSMNSYTLYYNKTMLAQAGIKSPPTTVAQLDADQAKEWKFSDGRLDQFGFYPNGYWDELMPTWNVSSFKSGKYDLASNPQAVALMDWYASYAKYPASAVAGLEAAIGNNAGGSIDAFTEGRAGFWVNGMWEQTDIKEANPSLKYGVEALPPPPGGKHDVSDVDGNYNIIPRGAPHPAAAFDYMAWMAGYDNESWAASAMPLNGWIPPSQSITKLAAYQKWMHGSPARVISVALEYKRGDNHVPVTAGEAEYENAITTAQTEVLAKKMTPIQALQMVDNVANKALASSPKGGAHS